jgi:hypothetical protein
VATDFYCFARSAVKITNFFIVMTEECSCASTIASAGENATP